MHSSARVAVWPHRSNSVDDATGSATAPTRPPTLEESLQELTERMRGDLTPEQRARLMSIAGDLCFEAGYRERALLYYDACIDLYLSAGRFAASAAICDKLIRISPEVIRARCTLAWLAIARGLDDEARRRVEEYGEASLRLERPTVAQRQLRAMAEEVESEDVLEAIAHALLKLGDAVSADRVFGLIHSPAARPRRRYATSEERDRAIICRLTHSGGA
jgi:tetratricopeptide (TPR) repeat protein